MPAEQKSNFSSTKKAFNISQCSGYATTLQIRGLVIALFIIRCQELNPGDTYCIGKLLWEVVICFYQF